MVDETSYTYLKFRLKAYRVWASEDVLSKRGDPTCPKCGHAQPTLKRIVAQATMPIGTEVTTFARCSECAHHFAWVLPTKKGLKAVMSGMENL